MRSTVAILRKYGLIRLLEIFLRNPSREYYLNELSRELNMSSSTVKTYVDALVSDNILVERKKGNLRIFTLNNENPMVKELKRAYFLSLLLMAGIDRIVEIGTVAVYGSLAKGEIDERSDIDILVISTDDINYDPIRVAEELTDRRIQISHFMPSVWELMKRSNEPFVKSVQMNHILIKGEPP